MRHKVNCHLDSGNGVNIAKAAEIMPFMDYLFIGLKRKNAYANPNHFVHFHISTILITNTCANPNTLYNAMNEDSA